MPLQVQGSEDKGDSQMAMLPPNTLHPHTAMATVLTALINVSGKQRLTEEDIQPIGGGIGLSSDQE